MKSFADLYAALDETTKTTEKVQALVDYFGQVSAADAAWAVYFLIGRKPRQVVPMPKLRAWAMEEADIPGWLFQESYDAVGDIAETIALLLPPPRESSDLPLEPLGRGAPASAQGRSPRTSSGRPFSRPGGRSTTGSGSSGTS